MADNLTEEERRLLLGLARQSLTNAVNGQKPPQINLKNLSPQLQAHGATFVTLTRRGNLRGCIGSLEPYLPLAEDVCEHAVAAGLQDFRFSPVQPAELNEIRIEISRLTPPVALEYDGPVELLDKLRPGIDGVVLADGSHRATFLPQVWEKLPDKVAFLEHLCQKMGAPADLWRRKKLQISIYQVEEFHE
jgi:uncharacterized protein